MDYELKRKLSRIGALFTAFLMVAGVAWSGIRAAVQQSRQETAVYPPLLRYSGEYYVLTGRSALDLPDDLPQVYAKCIGSQDEIPEEDGTCNFGKGLMAFRMGDEVAYVSDNSGNWLICEKLTPEEQ